MSYGMKKLMLSATEFSQPARGPYVLKRIAGSGQGRIKTNLIRSRHRGISMPTMERLQK
jgi:hypothetical protein